jgi:hypothetical protein
MARGTVGYIPFQIPSNMIITKVSRPGLCKPFRDYDFVLPKFFLT